VERAFYWDDGSKPYLKSETFKIQISDPKSQYPLPHSSFIIPNSSLMLPPSTVYLNGQFMSSDRATISPEDRGFYFADGVYEVIKYYKNQPFCFEEHMQRLKNSLAGVRISYSEVDKLKDICQALILANQLNFDYAAVYIQITRGVAVRTHRFPNPTVEPTVYARAFRMPACMNEMINGVKVLSSEDIRWLRCNIKSIALLPNTMMFEEVSRLGAFECMFVRNGMVTEASHSNIMAVKNGVVHTHPDSNFVLPGITKAAVIRICKELHIKVVEEPIDVLTLGDYAEWFLTGTGSEIVPVVQIDETLIGGGSPGPITRRLQKEFFRITYEKLAGEEITI
jgi:D-alanine transaminase